MNSTFEVAIVRTGESKGELIAIAEEIGGLLIDQPGVKAKEKERLKWLKKTGRIQRI